MEAAEPLVARDKISELRDAVAGREGQPFRTVPFGPWPFTLREAELLLDIADCADVLHRGSGNAVEEWQNIKDALEELASDEN
jgi:hypothetical protein